MKNRQPLENTALPYIANLAIDDNKDQKGSWFFMAKEGEHNIDSLPIRGLSIRMRPGYRRSAIPAAKRLIFPRKFPFHNPLNAVFNGSWIPRSSRGMTKPAYTSIV